MTQASKILFVDDEEKILKALTRRITSLHPSWEIFEATGGLAGLEVLSQTPCDLVVTDLLMPGMDGADFLTLVREKFPKTARIILSGHAQQDLMLRALSLSHQYFSKPCDTMELVAAMEKLLSSSSLIANDNLKSVIVHINQFPVLPETYHELVLALMDNQNGTGKISEIIARDPSLASKVMQVANSSFLGFSGKVGDLQEASMRLGAKTIHTIALMFKYFESFEKRGGSVLPQKAMWEHSVKTASLAANLIENYFKKPSLKFQAMTLGLLHDLGEMILADFSPGKYWNLIEISKKSSLALWKIEEESFGLSHAEAGALLFELWGLPPDMCQRVRYHHTPSLWKEAPQGDDLLSALHVGDVIDSLEGSPDEFDFPLLDMDYLQKAGLPSSDKFWAAWLRNN